MSSGKLFAFDELNWSFDSLFFCLCEVDIFRFESLITDLISGDKVFILACQESVATTTVGNLGLKKLIVLLIKDTDDNSYQAASLNRSQRQCPNFLAYDLQ
jgi:hypothetical protein